MKARSWAAPRQQGSLVMVAKPEDSTAADEAPSAWQHLRASRQRQEPSSALVVVTAALTSAVIYACLMEAKLEALPVLSRAAEAWGLQSTHRPEQAARNSASGGSGSAGNTAGDSSKAATTAERLIAQMQQHVAQHGPADTFHAAGCRWRAVPGKEPPSSPSCSPPRQRGKLFGGIESVWGCHAYEYWSDAQQEWVQEQPAACRLQAQPLDRWQQDMIQMQQQLRSSSSPIMWGSTQPVSTWQLQRLRSSVAGSGSGSVNDTSILPTQQQQQLAMAGAQGRRGGADLPSNARCASSYCILKNLWYSDGHFYFLRDDSSSSSSAAHIPKTWQLGRNRQGSVLSVRSAADFAASVSATVVTGETLLIDNPLWLHSRAVGHWLENLLPLFSVLLHEPLVRRTPDRLLLLYQQRANLCDWVHGMMAAVLGVLPGRELPPLIFQQEQADAFKQQLQLLEGVQPGQWVMFEQVLWPRDVFLGGSRACRDQADAQLLHSLIYAQYGVPLPVQGAPPPALITLQRKSANRRLLNEEEVVGMLREFGQVEVVEYGASSSMREQVAQMARTGVFISAHTSNLANALLLPPGAAVFEVLQRNWEWAGIDRFFYSLTEQMGDIHHYAQRAQGPGQTVFLNPTLGRLFGNWTAAQCWDSDCVEALTQVDVWVDVAALRELVAGRLALIRAGASVHDARLPWPTSKASASASKA